MRHVLIGRLGSSDRRPIPLGDGERATDVDLLNGERRLDHGIGRALEDLAHLGVYPTEIGVDLMILATLVHAADTRVARASESQDGWTRELRVVVPVSDRARWRATAGVLVTLLDFLTGDRWIVDFRQRPARAGAVSAQQRARLVRPRFDDLALFSGGLDSLIGAIDALEAGRSPLFISHAGEGATSAAQSALFDGLKRRYPQQHFERLRLWMAFPDNFVSGVAGENTTRGRSFLFFALGVFAGTGLPDDPSLKVPENGLIALNVPLDPLRLGSLSTRTTHPYYMARWNELLGLLDVPVRVENPYWDKTKGEMAQCCAEPALLRQLSASSLSCSAPTKGRWQGLGSQHCGYCLPCLIRRAALDAGFGRGNDPTVYTIANLAGRPLDTRQSEGQQVRSFQLAIGRLRARPDLAPILIHKPGPLVDEDPARQAALAEVYRRGLFEVGTLLQGVVARPL
jgi:hypothetical protein